METVKSVLSEAEQSRSQANMTTLDEIDAAHVEALFDYQDRVRLKKQNRLDMTECLGSIRAFELFTEKKFIVTDTNRKAFEAVKEWNPEKENLYLVGPVGSGKSHLQAIAVRRFQPRHFSVKRVSNICRNIRGATTAIDEQEIIDKYAFMPILGLDDLGMEKMTEFVIGILYEIIDVRYMNRPGGLIITSNLTISELSQKLGDDRIPSRLAQMCEVISLRGEKDWRIK